MLGRASARVYIDRMRRALHSIATGLLACVLAAACGPAAAQRVAPDYALTAPVLLDPELAPGETLAGFGPLELAAASSTGGSGLSLQAGQQWFARAAIGRSLDSEVVSIGGGYRFTRTRAVSMHVTRQLGQERLGLAVRYDFSRAYLRLAYEAPTRGLGADTVRFSAGMRF